MSSPATGGVSPSVLQEPAVRVLLACGIKRGNPLQRYILYCQCIVLWSLIWSIHGQVVRSVDVRIMLPIREGAIMRPSRSTPTKPRRGAPPVSGPTDTHL